MKVSPFILTGKRAARELTRIQSSRKQLVRELSSLRILLEKGKLTEERYAARKQDLLKGQPLHARISEYEHRARTLENRLSPMAFVIPVLLLLAVAMGFMVVPSFTGFFTYRNVSVSTDRVGLVFSDGGS
ncbi:MAG: hypothetical protein GXP63_02595, partial [DPANN group archaeon]|nr:hypothetical protein [DPANN group archaeon]